jgi:hypothetical protein
MIHYGNQTPEGAGHEPAMKRVLATVAVVAAALLLLLLVWYVRSCCSSLPACCWRLLL